MAITPRSVLKQRMEMGMEALGRSPTDAEHPSVIPMDLPSSLQAPRGPMTRARARALETEVTSLLNDISYDPLETWLDRGKGVPSFDEMMDIALVEFDFDDPTTDV